jgi:hypothetical protein
MAATYCDLKSTWGHDAFLVEVEEETRLIRNFLENIRQSISTKPPSVGERGTDFKSVPLKGSVK